MGTDLYKRDFGDSCRHVLDLQLQNSNHVFDGAGENIQYHSDSESFSSKKSKTRYINSAIYVESVESSHSVTSLQTDSSCPDDVTPHPHGTCRSCSTPLLTGRVSEASSSSVKSRKSIRLAIGEVDAEETPRCNRTYRGEGPDGQDTFRLSVASLSTTTTAKEERDRNERKKQEAFKQWVARKEQERRERERLRFESLKRQEASAPSAEQREESFQRWMERKRRQAERRRADELMMQYRHQEKLDQERIKREQAKDAKLTDWIKRKEEDMKLMKTRDERRAARLAIEEERRRIKGERAYRDWLRTSKNKPLPVPLNQGELSMRGSVSQMYINPKPWQSTI